MKFKKNISALFILLLMLGASCHSRKEADVNRSPHTTVPQADILYRQAMALMQSAFSPDSTIKCIRLLDEALSIDSLNPDYYGVKAKLLSEMGELDSALYVQTLAMKKKAITGEYLLQLGLFQAAKDMDQQAHDNFGKSRDILQTVLKHYPDSLGAFILAEAANALYLNEDSVFMKDIDNIRKQFPNRLMEIEMTRRLKPHSLIRQIKSIQTEKLYSANLDSIAMDAVKKSEREEAARQKNKN